MKTLVAVSVALLALASCPPSPTPSPVRLDGGEPIFFDAGAVTVLEASLWDSGDVCTLACLALVKAGCSQLPDCPKVLAEVTASLNGHEPLIRNPITQRALTCADVAAVRSAADVRALGQPCPDAGL